MVLAFTFLRRSAPEKAPAASQPQDAPGSVLSADEEQFLVCAACLSTVSHPNQRIRVQERHEHTFANPAGVVYRIGCFAAACGARPFGAPSQEHTWFAGYAWQMGVCSGCGEHLGWLFTGGGSSFWGLILEKLREMGSPRA
ncbi:MAG: hypothetical protein JW940_01700 [Polyangiaceae bacterium]|nr:hypothetical protein [Polyangiaceae bacterium]